MMDDEMFAAIIRELREIQRKMSAGLVRLEEMLA
jgi:hypothetical protein